MSDANVDQERRTWIAITCGAGAVGGVAVAVPFVSSFAPSERARAAGAPVQVDISGLKPGEKLTVEWRGKPVWIVRRTEAELAGLEKLAPELADPLSLRNQAELTPEYARNVWRSIKPEYLVLVGICTHLGCLPKQHFERGEAALGADWPGGFFCPCHGSKFDLAGRVMAGSPASVNLVVPPYEFRGDTIVIGVDQQSEGVA